MAIGPRPAGSPAIEQSRTYIKAQLAAAGVSVAEQAWEDQTPVGPVKMVNLIATIPGASKNRLIIAGHYDTKRFREFRFVGANDGGSSAAFLIELARVLKSPQERAHHRAALPRRRGSRRRVDRHRQHLRQPPLRRDRAEERVAGDG